MKQVLYQNTKIKLKVRERLKNWLQWYLALIHEHKIISKNLENERKM